MKILIVLLITFTIAQSNTEGIETRMNYSEEQDVIDFEKLYQTWYVKQILVDGQEDQENFPVSNDELTLNRDMTVISIDKTFDLVEKGTWEIKKPDRILIKTEEGPVTFKILKLTSTEFETKMVTDDIDMYISYRNEK
jgi:hypothetical protein